jgi:formate hydrogenlyase transcriptional activator
MLEINNSIVSHQTLPDLLRAIAVCLRRLIQDEFAGLVLHDPHTDQLLLHAIDTPNVEVAPPAGLPIPMASYPGLAFSSGEIVRRNRIDRSEFPEDPILHIQTREGRRVESLCVAPLLSHGRKLGVLGLASTAENSFSDDDVQLLGGIATQVAIAVENTLNFHDVQLAREQATSSRDRLELLLKVNNAVVSQLSLRELVRAVSSSLRETLGADVTAISLYDENIDQLRAYLFDLPQGFGPIEEGTPLPMDETVGSIAFKTGRPIFVDRIDTRMPASEFDRRMVEAGIRSGGVTPLVAHNRKLGTLGIGSKRESAFSKADQELLVHVANQIGIAVENALAYQEIEKLKNKLAEEKLYLEDEIRTEGNFEEIIGESPALRLILKRIEQVSPTDSTILIRGETGTGKELIARAIHNLSGRRERTLVKVNCAAIPMGLLESELFGHERGAFTGAISQRIGRFELAHQGTLFLDEVGDIPLELQPKLLRVLQEQQFERLGSTRTQQVDVRLVAATNSNLEEMVEKKQYRSDLYYRLNVFPITLPPLRERREDIPLLVRFFAQRFARRMKKRIESIPARTSALLTQYHWPGNIRELENVIERAVILSHGPELEIPIGELGIGQLQMSAAVSARQSGSPMTTGSADPSNLQSVERDHILRVLEETRWVVAGPQGAAQRLGMKRTTLQAKMRKLGIFRKNADA